VGTGVYRCDERAGRDPAAERSNTMPKYVFSYRAPKAYARGGDGVTEAWNDFRASLGDKVLDFGNPVFEVSNVGITDDTTRIGGYSFITADDLESAVALAKGAPIVAAGGGVEVGEVAEIM
jgi:hypothetical protein